MPHVVIVCRGLGSPGSVALVALRHGRELARHFRVTLISDSRAETPADISVPQEIVPVPNLHLLRRFRHAPDEVFFARAVRQRLFALHARDPIDFVFCEGHVPALLAAKRFRAATGVKFGVAIHGDVAEHPKGTFDKRLTALYDWAIPRANRAADLVTTSTPFFRDLAERRGARPETIVILPNGVDVRDLGLAEPIAPVTRHDVPLRILFAGRLSIEKGVEHLLAAMALVESATLTLAGGGPLESQLRAHASERIRFLGAIPRRELGALYREHDVACLPSLSDTFPLSAIEALACGVPVIATTIIREIVQPEMNGLQVPPADARALADAIARVANDATLHARLAENAHDSVLPRLSWTAIGDQLAGHIQSRL
jgi:glycosyltransferase involved in cell wall biosynthesis